MRASAITANATSFTMTTSLASGSSHAVTVRKSPGLYCAVASGSGTVSSADVSNISITGRTVDATTAYTFSGILGEGGVTQDGIKFEISP